MVEERRLPLARPARQDLAAGLAVGAGEIATHPRLGRRVLVDEGHKLRPEPFFVRPPGQMHRQSSTVKKNGGTPRSDFANSASALAAIASIVHASSAVASVIGRQPSSTCTTPPCTLTT